MEEMLWRLRECWDSSGNDETLRQDSIAHTLRRHSQISKICLIQLSSTCSTAKRLHLFPSSRVLYPCHEVFGDVLQKNNESSIRSSSSSSMLTVPHDRVVATIRDVSRFVKIIPWLHMHTPTVSTLERLHTACWLHFSRASIEEAVHNASTCLALLHYPPLLLTDCKQIQVVRGDRSVSVWSF